MVPVQAAFIGIAPYALGGRVRAENLFPALDF